MIFSDAIVAGNNIPKMSGQKLQLTLYATALKNVAGRGKGTSDPYAEVKLIASGSDADAGILLGRTESIKNSLSPKWTTTFSIDDNLNLGKEACIKVSVADKIRKDSDKFIGCKFQCIYSTVRKDT